MSLGGFPEKANKKEVFVIDLAKDSLVVIPGKNEEAFRQAFKAALESLGLGDGPCELHDWGGVISNALDVNRSKLCLANTTAFIFSFTPWNAKGKEELPKMMDFAKSAGFAGMIITTTKEGTRGKADVFSQIRCLSPDIAITYYEDTYDVIKQCVSSNTTCYHVPSPEFPVAEESKVPGVVDGSINGYLERWEANSNTRPSAARCSGSASQGPPQTVAGVDLSDLNQYLAHHSYLGSEIHATEVDYQKLSVVSSMDVDPKIFPHLHRWRSHISFLKAKFGDFQGS